MPKCASYIIDSLVSLGRLCSDRVYDQIYFIVTKIDQLNELIIDDKLE